ncbi:unnamed protein product [Rotaria sp. Silwood1]|nr:unnamed protein product [Rotaria sp. Silwood1]
MASQHEDVLKYNVPYLVAEEVRFASCLSFLYGVKNLSKKKDMHGKGHDDRLLLNALSHEAELVGVRKMIAGISDLGNERSISLHRSAEFTHVGILRTCGWKFNR